MGTKIVESGVGSIASDESASLARSPLANRTQMFDTLYIGAEKFPNRESFSVNISGILWKILFKHLWWRMWILVVRLIYFKFSKILHQIYWRYILKIINLYILSFKPWCVMPNCRISQFIQDSGEGKYTCFRTKKFSLDTTVSDELSYDDKKTSHAKKSDFAVHKKLWDNMWS